MTPPAVTDLRICYLAERPDAAEVLAAWFAREWGDGSAERTAAGYARQLVAAVGSGELPVCLLGLLDDEPVATATLKFREIEYAPEADFWLGWVCARPDARNRGYGRALVAAVEAEAAARRLPRLYLHTPSAEAFYRSLGWRSLERVTAEGRLSTVMTKSVAR